MDRRPSKDWRWMQVRRRIKGWCDSDLLRQLVHAIIDERGRRTEMKTRM
jgi:hypothetical protein